MQLPDDALLSPRKAALQAHGLGEEHNLRDGALSAQLLGFLRVAVATPGELDGVATGAARPTAGPLNPQNERQALETLGTALGELAAPLEAAALLQAGGVDAVLGTGGAAVDRGAPAGTRNENGLSTNWSTSLEFCRIYLEGQRAIVLRAQRERAALLRELDESGAAAGGARVVPPSCTH